MSHATVTDLLRDGTSRLAKAGVDRARVEAEWLLADLLHTSPLTLQLDGAAVPFDAREQYWLHIARRAQGIPLQYVTGRAAFFDLLFDVEPGVFIPRPETEAVVERALEALRARQAGLGRGLRMVDVGTGSGCIAATLARALPACLVVGIEVSWSALLVAQRNLKRHGLLDRVRVVQGRWLEPILVRVDAIVSNPPYVPTDQVDRLPLTVRQEPRVSLDGGADGLRDVNRLLAAAPDHLQSRGLLIMECGEEQAVPLGRRATALPWVASVALVRDLAGRPRGLIIERTD